jgi:two-component system, LytTR family, sensor kinase
MEDTNGTINVQMSSIEPDDERPRTAKSLQLISGRELSKSKLFYLLHTAGWVVIAVISGASDFSKKGLWPAIMEDVLWAACGWVLTLGFRPIYRRARLKHRSYAVYGLFCLLLSVPGGALWYSSSEALIRLGYYIAGHFAGVWPMFAAAAKTDAAYPWWIDYSYWLFFSSFLFTWSSLYFGINAMLDLETEKANVARALKLADTAHLRALQSNLNPHFLFNALNGIATLVREGDVTAASAMIDALSVLLRSTLQRVNTAEIRVSEELQLIEQYLRIQRFRFGERLRSTVITEPEALDALIPTLILQPLVENAVRHGVLPREDGGSLWISIRKVAETLVVSVEDDGPGLKQGVINAVGLGLENSRDRLAALYGTTAQLEAGPRIEGGFAVIIRMPFRRAAAPSATDSSAALTA